MDKAQLKYLIVDKIYDINDCDKLLKIKTFIESESLEETDDNLKDCSDAMEKEKK